MGPPFLSELDGGETDPRSYYPPVPMPDDASADFLVGSMNLRVVLPSGQAVRMSVERKTPMMDLLIQVTTRHHINPGGHVIQVINQRSDDFLYYKPSTPIGALDASTIHIVPKHKISDASVMKKVPMKILNQPFETTFRLQVRLPKNQLAVIRVSPKTTIAQVLRSVCKDKHWDHHQYEVRHPDHVDEKLRPDVSLSDYGFTEVTVVPKGKSASRSVSTSDILRLQSIGTSSPEFDPRHPAAHSNLAETRARLSFVEGSLSSGSLGDRRDSPDRSISPPTTTNPSVMPRGQDGESGNRPRPAIAPSRSIKKRPAPRPPPGTMHDSQSAYDVERQNLDPRDARSPSSPRSEPTKSVSMSCLASRRDNAYVGSTTSINSVGLSKKRRAPAPPAIKILTPSDHAIIPEETPSLLRTEENVAAGASASAAAHRKRDRKFTSSSPKVVQELELELSRPVVTGARPDPSGLQAQEMLTTDDDELQMEPEPQEYAVLTPPVPLKSSNRAAATPSKPVVSPSKPVVVALKGNKAKSPTPAAPKPASLLERNGTASPVPAPRRPEVSTKEEAAPAVTRTSPPKGMSSKAKSRTSNSSGPLSEQRLTTDDDQMQLEPKLRKNAVTTSPVPLTSRNISAATPSKPVVAPERNKAKSPTPPAPKPEGNGTTSPAPAPRTSINKSSQNVEDIKAFAECLKRDEEAVQDVRPHRRSGSSVNRVEPHPVVPRPKQRNGSQPPPATSRDSGTISLQTRTGSDTSDIAAPSGGPDSIQECTAPHDDISTDVNVPMRTHRPPEKPPRTFSSSSSSFSLSLTPTEGAPDVDAVAASMPELNLDSFVGRLDLDVDPRLQDATQEEPDAPQADSETGACSGHKQAAETLPEGGSGRTSIEEEEEDKKCEKKKLVNENKEELDGRRHRNEEISLRRREEAQEAGQLSRDAESPPTPIQDSRMNGGSSSTDTDRDGNSRELGFNVQTLDEDGDARPVSLALEESFATVIDFDSEGESDSAPEQEEPKSAAADPGLVNSPDIATSSTGGRVRHIVKKRDSLAAASSSAAGAETTDKRNFATAFERQSATPSSSAAGGVETSEDDGSLDLDRPDDASSRPQSRLSQRSLPAAGNSRGTEANVAGGGGPMKFSINSYNERETNEVPYEKKLSRNEPSPPFAALQNVKAATLDSRVLKKRNHRAAGPPPKFLVSKEYASIATLPRRVYVSNRMATGQVEEVSKHTDQELGANDRGCTPSNRSRSPVDYGSVKALHLDQEKAPSSCSNSDGINETLEAAGNESRVKKEKAKGYDDEEPTKSAAKNDVTHEGLENVVAAKGDNSPDASPEEEMLVRDPRGGPPAVIYAYAGPPSIQMSTWDDRGVTSRSSRARSEAIRSHGYPRSASAGSGNFMAPPIPPPPAGYPHPQMYQPVIVVPQPYVAAAPYVVDPAGYAPECKSPSRKSGHHRSTQRLEAGHEKPAKERGKRAVSSGRSSQASASSNKKKIDVRYVEKTSNGVEKKQEVMRDPACDVLAASKRPSATNAPGGGEHFVGNREAALVEAVKKANPPQFYFGQSPSDERQLEMKKRHHQTAIEKVKRNEAVSHPKKRDEESETNKASTSPTSCSSSAISSLSSPSSSTRSSSRSSSRRNVVEPDEGYRSPSLPKEGIHEESCLSARQMSPSLVRRQQSQDEIRMAFEAELQAGKSRLRKFQPPPTGGVQVMPNGRLNPRRSDGRDHEVVTVDGPNKPPPPPIHPSGKIIQPGKIPVAPKLPKLFTVSADVHSSRSTTTSSSSSSSSTPQLSPREALLMDIKNKGGVNGLRKTNAVFT